MKNFVREDTKANNGEMGLDRTTVLTNKKVEDMRRRAITIFKALAGRQLRSGEAKVLTSGFTNREDGDTNWLCIAHAAELAKGGFEAIITDSGETIIKKVQKG